MRVKLFEAEHEEDLEEEMNTFLTNVHETNVIDVRYQVSMAVDEYSDGLEAVYSFSAMILYRE
ncbi:sporulation protein Cse60 [Alkalihalobacillus sp. AL-G]|uniref:sporulation protein Cse60 n=1 Tax=Alkalihalobacillus sp. AL-G TaxID=2926399 RepID=UPI00272AF19C|nr:sporulation protein Cse60 [Alkalihalobacillus sp. AL-G]WLD92443.1 sporulation protein Cse60 [Alkalihalobacillus sp. AL-G]